MRTMGVKTLALALMLAGAGFTLGQQQAGQPPKKVIRAEEEEGTPKPKKVRVELDVNAPKAGGESKLEEMLAEALKNNPDLRVAAARLAKADAELNRTRLQVTQKVVSLYYAIDTQRKVIAHQETRWSRMVRANQANPGTFAKEDIDELQNALIVAKGKLAELEAEVPALLGKSARAEGDAGATDAAMWRGLEWLTRQQVSDLAPLEDRRTARALAALSLAQQATGPTADRIRKALETPIQVDYKEAKLTEILKDLEKKAPGLSFQNRYSGISRETRMTLSFDKPLPVATVLQALEDLSLSYNPSPSVSGLCFVVRQYGILVTARGAVPPGAVTAEEFLRQKPAKAPAASESKVLNPPPGQVEGEVKEVNGRLMVITLGSDAGLAKGHTLDLFRLSPKAAESKYLGTIRIVEVSAKEAVAQTIGRPADTPRVGDRVGNALGK